MHLSALHVESSPVDDGVRDLAGTLPETRRGRQGYPGGVGQPIRFGRYRVTGPLGAGAMGEVHAAVDEVLGREVAVKTLKPQRGALAARIVDERFRLEARAIAALSHPGVVAVFDIDLDADPPYLVMERVAGPSLRELLAPGPLAISELRALGIQIARALAAAHALGIVHRDVKPANILAAGPGTWKLADFGVAHVPDSSLTMTGQFVGSPAYAPPEALLRGQCDREGDVYGLGATLYQAAAGRWPRLDASTGALIPPVPPLGELAPGLPPDLAAIIDRAIAVEPGVRPTAAELADALAGAGSVPGVTAVVPPVTRIRWQPWAVAGAIGVMLAIVVATSGGDHPSAALAPGAGSPVPLGGAPPAALPTSFEVATPPMTDGKAEKDWTKVLDQLRRGHVAEARKKLDEWERKHGASPETAALRQQLEAVPDSGEPGEPGEHDGPGGPRGRGHGD